MLITTSDMHHKIKFGCKTFSSEVHGPMIPWTFISFEQLISSVPLKILDDKNIISDVRNNQQISKYQQMFPLSSDFAFPFLMFSSAKLNASSN